MMAERPRAERRSSLRLLLALVAVGLLALIAGYLLRAGSAGSGESLDRQAQRFVGLALMLGRLAPSEVDSYFGPPALAPAADSRPPPMATLRADVAQLAATLHGDSGGGAPRRARLADRTERLLALIDIMGLRAPLPFDVEARRLYGIEPTPPDQAAFQRARTALDRLLPGSGPLSARVDAFRQRYIVPDDRRTIVFDRALAECRRRTLLHWQLPSAEHVDVEWTSAVDAAWHRYRGDFTSTLQINPQAVAFLGSAIDVACHEAYPGHHTQFVMAEAAVGKGRLPIEDRIVMLRSPASVLREGAAEYGVSLVFPAEERLAFERDVLFPLAGFAPGEAARFEQVRALLYDLAPAALPILRAYRDHALTSDDAAVALERDALIASPQPLLAFVDTLGAYTTGYTSAREQVRQRVEAGSSPVRDMRWATLRCLLLAADDAPLARDDKTALCRNANDEVMK